MSLSQKLTAETAEKRRKKKENFVGNSRCPALGKGAESSSEV
jgi:hypothetical protein